MRTGRIIPVILSGGAGTRLWPLSRAGRPKQFHALAGAATMLQMTAERVKDEARFTPPLVVASGKHADEVEAQLGQAGVQPDRLILEPAARNTAAAIALAALEAEPSALLLVMPSDHVIAAPERLIAAVEAAAPFADDGYLMTFGIRPDGPETGYGYIKVGETVGEGVSRVDRFVEKPDGETASAYLQQGGYLWNGGIFLFRADHLIEGLERHAADILASVRASLAAARREGAQVHPEESAFAGARSQSIDHALMEVHAKVAVVPVEMGWSDLGSWDALYEISAKDDEGNAVMGPVTAEGTANCLLRSEGPKLVTIGVQDLIVIATGDAVIVMPRGESQQVKDVVEKLQPR